MAEERWLFLTGSHGRTLTAGLKNPAAHLAHRLREATTAPGSSADAHRRARVAAS